MRKSRLLWLAMAVAGLATAVAIALESGPS